VEPLDPGEAFRIMEDFVDALEEGKAQRILARAQGLHRPFRHFRDALQDFPSVRERWLRYQEGRMGQRAEEWLEERLPGARLG
jgi:hypothetical protein